MMTEMIGSGLILEEWSLVIPAGIVLLGNVVFLNLRPTKLELMEVVTKRD